MEVPGARHSLDLLTLSSEMKPGLGPLRLGKDSRFQLACLHSVPSGPFLSEREPVRMVSLD